MIGAQVIIGVKSAILSLGQPLPSEESDPTDINCLDLAKDRGHKREDAYNPGFTHRGYRLQIKPNKRVSLRLGRISDDTAGVFIN